MAILFDRQYDLVYMKNRVLPNSFERKGCLWTSRSSRLFEILSKLLSSEGVLYSAYEMLHLDPNTMKNEGFKPLKL